MNGYSEFRIGGTGARAAQPVRGLDLAQVPFGMRSAGQNFALTFMRHMYEYGTTSAQVARVKVAHSRHASQNPKALLKERVTVERSEEHTSELQSVKSRMPSSACKKNKLD